MHIAGTNGKGSVTAYLKAMLRGGGRSACTSTPPRISCASTNASSSPAPTARRARSARASSSTCWRARRRINGGDDITQFEITTAAAFLAFAEHPADVLLLEVGLGGRLDATNVIERPALSVITPISMDHAEKLGATLAKIACEKAGILQARRAGGHCAAGARGRAT